MSTNVLLKQARIDLKRVGWRGAELFSIIP